MRHAAPEVARRRARRRFLCSPWLTLALLFAVFLFGRAAWGMAGKAREAREAAAEAEANLAQIEASRASLAAEAAALASPSGLEKELRSRFNVAKAGEEAVVIVEAAATTSALAAPAAAPGWGARVWGSLTGWLR